MVELNRAVAIWKADGPEAALPILSRLEQGGQLENYYLLPATLGHLHQALGDLDAARGAFERALTLTPQRQRMNSAERRFLERRLASLRF